jgi:hypothetical protein
VEVTNSRKVRNPDPEILKEDLHNKEAFINGFCIECGSYLEFNEDQIKKDPISDIEVGILNPSSQYICTDRCTTCLSKSHAVFEVQIIPGTN